MDNFPQKSLKLFLFKPKRLWTFQKKLNEKLFNNWNFGFSSFKGEKRFHFLTFSTFSSTFSLFFVFIEYSKTFCSNYSYLSQHSTPYRGIYFSQELCWGMSRWRIPFLECKQVINSVFVWEVRVEDELVCRGFNADKKPKTQSTKTKPKKENFFLFVILLSKSQPIRHKKFVIKFRHKATSKFNKV